MLPEQQQENNFISPLLFLGIFLMIAPMITRIFNFQLYGWISGLGVAVIILAVIHTGYVRISG